MRAKTILTRSLHLGTLAALLALGAGCKQHTAEQPAPPSDQQIADSVQTKISAEGALNGQNIQVGVQNGVATLSGSANDDASRSLAGNDAGSVAGVKTVVNNLTVQPPQQAAAPAPPPERASASTRERDRKESRRERREKEEQAAQQATPPPPPPPPQRAPEQVQTVPPPPPPAPPQPVVKTVTIPAGTVVPVRITDTLDSATAQPNQTFHGSLAGDLVANGMVAIPQGATVAGRVIDAKDAAHFKGSSLLSIELTQIDAHGRQIPVVTDAFSKEGKGRGKNTAIKTGGGALLGGIIGALAGGGKGAAVGAAAGGGLGAGANGVTRGEQVQIQPETQVNFKLQSPITVTTSRVLGASRPNEDNSPQLQQRP